ncbi:hypothetical protein LTR28_013321 [Elasticomyces elasticus]|nr:hypothetical protein LTR28_013321 [Elasticomyces elasticus]
MIYEYTIVSDTDLHLPSFLTFTTEAQQPALTRTNRQLRLESLPLFYGKNCFVGDCLNLDFRHTVRWLSCIGHRRARLIRRLRIEPLNGVTCYAGLLPWVRFCASKCGRSIRRSLSFATVDGVVSARMVDRLRAGSELGWSYRGTADFDGRLDNTLPSFSVDTWVAVDKILGELLASEEQWDE